MSDSAPTAADSRRLAQEARDRVRFEEEALELSDQVYRVARRLVGSREEADDLVQQTYERAFRSWRQYTPGTNLRAWLLRILTNLNIDRGRRQQRTPQTTSLDNEAGDYFLYNKLESQVPDENPDEERVLERLSQDSIVEALADVPHDFRDAIVLVDIGEFSYADAAQILDIPIGTVMSRSAPRQAYPEEEPRRQGGGGVIGCDMIDWCDKCEEMMQPFLDGTLSDREVAGGRGASREVQLVREALPLRRAAAALRARRGHRADAARAEGEARRRCARRSTPRRRTSTSPGGRRSEQSTSTGSRARPPSSGISPQALRASTTGWLRVPS